MTDDGPPTDPASLVKWMDAMDAYRDKAMFNSTAPGDDDGDEVKAVIVAYEPGERVRLVGGEPGEWGIVTTLIVRPGCIVYQVSWPAQKNTTDHFAMELEDAD